MIERFSEAMGAALAGNNFSPIPLKSSRPEISSVQSIKTLLTLQLSQYRKSSSMFSSSEPVAARSDCRQLGNTVFVLARPTRASRAGELPRELGR